MVEIGYSTSDQVLFAKQKAIEFASSLNRDLLHTLIPPDLVILTPRVDERILCAERMRWKRRRQRVQNSSQK